MRFLRVLTLVYSLFVVLPLAAQYEVPPKYEYRAVWLTTIENLDWPRRIARDEAGVMAQRSELVSMLDSLQALNVNAVFLQTRVRGDVVYPSDIEPFARLLTGVAGKAPDTILLHLQLRSVINVVCSCTPGS